MATSPERVCWDACAWIALIQEEAIDANGVGRATRCKSVLSQAIKGKLEIVTSALSLAEVCKVKDVKASDPTTFSDFFENDYLLVVNVDREVGTFARGLMMAGLPGLKPADACHLATAALTPGVIALHTFDDKLLNLTGQVTKFDSGPLKICFPDVSAPPPPLLEER